LVELGGANLDYERLDPLDKGYVGSRNGAARLEVQPV